MKSNNVKFYSVLIGAFLFNILFWQEKMGLNTLFYDAFLLIALFSLYPEARPVSTVRWLLAGHLICLAMILVQNTILSMIAFSVTFLLLVAYIQYVHRSLWYASGSILLNLLFAVPSFFEIFETGKQKPKQKWAWSKWVRISILPIALLLVFYFLYSNSNSVFAEFVQKLVNKLAEYFTHFFEFFSWGRIGFFIVGLFFTAVFLLRNKLNYFVNLEKNKTDELKRNRIAPASRKTNGITTLVNNLLGRFAKGMMALKNISSVGLISLVLLNILLFVVNAIDISYIWFGYKFGDKVNLTSMIHEGTGILIVSIILAIIVLLVVFEGNLNFYTKSKYLKWGAYCWIAQNFLLVISVLLRDYYYIHESGLAYKRIGVLFYLALVLVGLVTVFWKIYRKKTNYYLFRVNAWAVIVLLVFSTVVDWDEWIADYNISHNKNILLPVDFMVGLSNKALIVLDKERGLLKSQQQQLQSQGIQWPYRMELDELIDWRIRQYRAQQQGYSWLSWNLSDQQLNTYFNTPTIKQ